MLECILGRAGSGKSTLLLSKLGEAHACGDNCILIVPEQFSLEAERALIAELGRGGLMNAQVLSFSRLMHYVFERSGGPQEALIDAYGRALLTRKALLKLGDEAGVFAVVAGTMGFAQKLTITLSKLKAYGLSPKECEEIAEGLPEGVSLKERLKVIARVYERVEEYMNRRYLDAEDALAALSRRIPLTKELREARVFIDGFESLSKQWRDIVAGLLTTCKSVHIALSMNDPGDGDQWIFERQRRVLALVKGAAADAGVEVETTRAGRPQEITAELKHLEANLFSSAPLPYAGDVRAIRVLRSGGPFEEADAIARAIIELYREQGCSFSEMAIVCAGGEGEWPLLRTLRQYNIPFFADEKRKLTGHPLIRTALLALACAQQGFKARDMLELSKTGCALLSVREAQRLQTYARAHLHPFASFKKPFKRGDEALVAEMEELRARVMEPLQILADKLEGKSIDAQARALIDYLAAVDACGSLDGINARLMEASDLEGAAFSAQCYDELLNVLSQLSSLLSNEAGAPGELADLVKAALMAKPAAIIPSSQNQVLIAKWGHSYLPDVRALFVIGANDGRCPPLEAQDPVLGDAELSALEALGHRVAPGAYEAYRAQQFELYRMLTKPTELLFFSVPAATLAGEGQKDAPVLTKLFRLFPKLKAEGSALGVSARGVSARGVSARGVSARGVPAPGAMGAPSSERVTLSRLISLLDEGELSGLWRAAAKHFERELSRWIAVYEAPMAPPNIMLSTDIRGAITSVSQLEMFNRCPFSFFVRYALRPSRLQEFAPGALDAGSFAHRVMERLASRVMAMGYLPGAHEQDELIADCTRSCAVEYRYGIFLESARHRSLLASLTRGLRYSLSLMIDQLSASDFSLYSLEHPVTLNLNGATLYGKIDRIDALEIDGRRSFRIIDYKSQSRKLDCGALSVGTELQLTMYANAMKADGDVGALLYSRLADPIITTDKRGEAAALERMRDARPDGLLLGDVNLLKRMDHTLEPGRKANFIRAELNGNGALSKRSVSAVDHDELDAVLSFAKRKADATLSAIIAGDTRPSPVVNSKGVSACAYCDYASVCRFDRGFSEARERYTPQLKLKEFLESLSE